MVEQTQFDEREDSLYGVGVGIWRWEIAENRVDYSEEWKRIRGYEGSSIDSTLNESTQRVHPDHRDELVAHRQRLVDGNGDSFELEYRVRHKDGTWIWIEERTRAIREGNNLIRLIGCEIDITRRKAEEASRPVGDRHQERLQEILEATSDYIGVSTPQREILWHNKSLAEFRPDMCVPENPDFGTAHPEWSLKVMEEVAIPAAVEHGSWRGEMAIFDIDGNEVPVSQVLIAHRTPDGSIDALSTIMRDISEQKAAERALRESEQLFSRLAASAPVAIFRTTPQDESVYVNDQWGEMTQRPLHAALGKGWVSSVHPDDLERLMERRKEFEQNQDQMICDPQEIRHVLPDGSFRWILCTLAKELDENGSVSGYIGTLTDIDQVKRAEQELAQFHERFSKVLKLSAIGIWEWCPKDGSLCWDEQMCEIYGVDAANPPADQADWAERVHPDDLARLGNWQGMANFVPNALADTEFRIVRPSGDVRHVYSNLYIERDSNGATVRAIGINMDITVARVAERALRESESRFQKMVTNVPGMIYRYLVRADGSQQLVYVSPKCREMFGIAPELAMENSDLLYTTIHQDDREHVRETFRHSAQTLEKVKTEYRVVLPGRGTAWRQTTAQPKKYDNGNLVWDGVTVDITHRKMTERQLKVANDELAKATRLKDEFLANMSHELRTPLSAILSATEGLQRGLFGEVSDNQRDSYDVIKESGDHLLALINEVLDLAKIESGRMDLEYSEVDVAKLCESAIPFISQLADKKQIQVNLNLQQDLPLIQADEQRIRQILINLLSNAVKFTKQSGRVTLTAERLQQEDTTDHIRFSVADTGIGIPESSFDSLFQPFVQLDSSLNRKYGGTGLGLAVVKRFTELHSGTVAVSSVQEQGSEFVVTIPTRVWRPRPAQTEPTEVYSDARSVIHSGAEKPLVLLAEDNELVAKTSSGILEALHYRVHVAVDGASAIESARDINPDIILMDVQLPGVDGLEAIRQIRGLPDAGSTPIIALTGLAMSGDAERCLQAGADRYMRKPCRIDELIECMRALLLKAAS